MSALARPLALGFPRVGAPPMRPVKTTLQLGNATDMTKKKNLKDLFIDDLGKVTGGKGGPIYTTLALGEEDDATTMALGEEGPTETTLALGEEDGGI